MTADTGDNGRDGRGRFAVGNTAGRGNPIHRRACELRRELLDVAGPALPQVVAQLVQRAIEGDTMAARVLLDRMLGTARQEAPQTTGLDLGDLGSPRAVTAAAASVARSMASGELDADAAAAVLAALDAVRRGHEADRLDAIEQRLAQLEGLEGDAPHA